MLTRVCCRLGFELVFFFIFHIWFVPPPTTTTTTPDGDAPHKRVHPRKDNAAVSEPAPQAPTNLDVSPRGKRVQHAGDFFFFKDVPYFYNSECLFYFNFFFGVIASKQVLSTLGWKIVRFPYRYWYWFINISDDTVYSVYIYCIRKLYWYTSYTYVNRYL